MQKKCPRNTPITRKSEEDCGENPSLLPSPVGGLFLAWLLDPKNFFSCDSRVSWATPIAWFRLRRVFKPVICGPNQCGRERVAADLRAAVFGAVARKPPPGGRHPQMDLKTLSRHFQFDLRASGWSVVSPSCQGRRAFQPPRMNKSRWCKLGAAVDPGADGYSIHCPGPAGYSAAYQAR